MFRHRLARGLPDRKTLIWWGLLVNTEALLVFVYIAFVADGAVHRPLFYLYPFVWLNVAFWAVQRVTRPTAGRHVRWGGGAVALGYFAVLSYAGGLVGFSGGSTSGLRVALISLPPGWAPALLYDGTTVSVALLPFKVVGYAAISYLVYVVVLDIAGRRPTDRQMQADNAASGAIVGFLGVFSCVSCTLPVVASVLSGFVGGGAALVSVAYGQSYLLSTAAFVVTVMLLTWRPTFGTIRRMLA